jgi:hypothetical protein
LFIKDTQQNITASQSLLRAGLLER